MLATPLRVDGNLHIISEISYSFKQAFMCSGHYSNSDWSLKCWHSSMMVCWLYWPVQPGMNDALILSRSISLEMFILYCVLFCVMFTKKSSGARQTDRRLW